MRVALILAMFSVGLGSQLSTQGPADSPALTTTVGPPRGTVIADGGFATHEIYSRFIEAAGGPDALIIDVPTANLGDRPVSRETRQTLGLKEAGAKNILVLHTVERKIADSETFVEPIKRAGGVWFEGGQPSRLVDTYVGTKTDQEVGNLLARGGAVGGLSAGAVILASHLPQDGAVPVGYDRGFGYLRGVAIEPHVIAREWLQTFGDWLAQKQPDLLGMAVDEGSAWVVRGDRAEVIGRSKGFIYGGKDPNDTGTPFLVLHPGDQYNLATRHVLKRAIDGSSLTEDFVDSLFSDEAKFGSFTAAVLVAQNGNVLVNKSYNIPRQPNYVPTTTVPYFTLGGLSDVYNAVAIQLLASDGKLSLDDRLDDSRVTLRQYLLHQADVPNGSRELSRIAARNSDIGFPDFIIQRWGSPYGAYVARRLFEPVGISRTTVDVASSEFRGSVDDLYRLESGLENPRVFPAWMAPGMTIGMPAEATAAAAKAAPPDVRLGWRKDTYRDLTRLSVFGTNDGKRHVYVRIPDKRISIIILTNKDDVDAQAIAQRITDRMLPASGR